MYTWSVDRLPLLSCRPADIETRRARKCRVPRHPRLMGQSPRAMVWPVV